MNKRKRQSIDPKRVHEYNKFLATLDQTNKNTEKSVENDPSNTPNIKNINCEEHMKQFIDKLIVNLDQDFSNNNYGAKNFTGQTENDVQKSNEQVEDPNYYK